MYWDQERFHTVYKLADALAEYALAGVTDKQGKPLIDHCRRVAERCRQLDLSQEQQLAAILHDVIEDGPEHAQLATVIDKLFGEEVYSMVRVLSRQKSQTYKQYIWIIKAFRGGIVVPIKLQDLADNTDQSRGYYNEELRARYLKAINYLKSGDEY